MLFKPTQLSVWCRIFFCTCVFGVSCNLRITLQPCMGSTRQPNFHSPDQTLYQSFSFFSSPRALRCHLPPLSLVSVFSKAHFSPANCYLWTFVCSQASLLTIQLIAIICYSALVLILGMGAVK